MKITINIPDRFNSRRFILLAGTELVAAKEPESSTWMVKKTSCNLCGDCCMHEPVTVYGVDDEGKCNALKKYGDTWECAAGVEKPFNCLADPRDIDCCSIRYEAQ